MVIYGYFELSSKDKLATTQNKHWISSSESNYRPLAFRSLCKQLKSYPSYLLLIAQMLGFTWTKNATEA